MLSQQEIQKMLEEIGLSDLDEKSRLAEFDKWTKLASGENNIQLQTFIEITSTTPAYKLIENHEGIAFIQISRQVLVQQ